MLDRPVDLPEGAHVRVTLDADDDLRSDGRPWPKTPEEIEAFIAEADAIPPMMTEEECAAWDARRAAEKDLQKGLMEKNAAEISRLFP